MHKIFANSLFIGKQVISLPSCHSTNDLMAEMTAKNQLHEGAIITTEHQIKGKGQRGNTWNSPAEKNLTFSIFLKPNFLQPIQQFELNRMVSLALLDVVKEELENAKVFVKWPNDLMVNKKKIAGILIENTISAKAITESIVGIGMNINQVEDVLDTATSMAKIGEKEFDRDGLLSKIVQRIEHYYFVLRSGDFRLIHQLYEKNLYLKDKVAYFEDQNQRFNGIIRDVEADGTINIEQESGDLKSYQFKEVKLLSS